MKPFDGIRDVFRVLTESGARVALATDCKGLPFKRYMSLLNADEFIAATACGDDVEHGKPDPRLVGVALRKLALPGSQAVMVGDTPYDAEAGLEAGTKAAGVLTGGFSADVLTGAGCFAVGEDLRGLLPSLLSGEAAVPTSSLTCSRAPDLTETLSETKLGTDCPGNHFRVALRGLPIPRITGKRSSSVEFNALAAS